MMLRRLVVINVMARAARSRSSAGKAGKEKGEGSLGEQHVE